MIFSKLLAIRDRYINFGFCLLSWILKSQMTSSTSIFVGGCIFFSIYYRRHEKLGVERYWRDKNTPPLKPLRLKSAKKSEVLFLQKNNNLDSDCINTFLTVPLENQKKSPGRPICWWGFILPKIIIFEGVFLSFQQLLFFPCTMEHVLLLIDSYCKLTRVEI